MWVLLPRVNDKNGDLSFKNLDTNVSLCNYLMQFLTKAFFFFFSPHSLSLSLLDSAFGFKLYAVTCFFRSALLGVPGLPHTAHLAQLNLCFSCYPGKYTRRGPIVPGGSFFTHVIVGKAEMRTLTLGKYPFNVAQGDKKSLEL